MWRLAIASVLALAVTAANAQDTKQAPPVAPANGTRPFLFDGRMKDDGVRQRTPAGDRGGAIIMPPKQASLRRSHDATGKPRAYGDA